MTTKPTRSKIRSLAAAVLAVALFAATGQAAAISVDSIVSTRAADLVLLQAGHDNGLRQGMTLRVTRAGKNIGEILLVDLRRQAAAALILGLEDGQTIQPGDTLAIKTIKA